MKKILAAAAAGTLALAAALPAQAQSTSNANSGTGLRMPYQNGFWGYVGASGGASEFGSCGGNILFSCDKRDSAWKVYGGGKFNEMFGLELGFLDLGRANFAGGSTEARGIDLALTGGVPLGANSSVFLKLGTVYGETDTHGSPAGLGDGRNRD